MVHTQTSLALELIQIHATLSHAEGLLRLTSEHIVVFQHISSLPVCRKGCQHCLGVDQRGHCDATGPVHPSVEGKQERKERVHWREGGHGCFELAT